MWLYCRVHNFITDFDYILTNTLVDRLLILILTILRCHRLFWYGSMCANVFNKIYCKFLSINQ